MKKQYYFFLFLFGVVLVGAGCSNQNEVEKQAQKTDGMVQDEVVVVDDHHADGGHTHEASVIEAGNQIQFVSSDPFSLGEQKLRFTLHSQSGEELGDHEIARVHEEKVHLLLVKDDLTEYHHVHPVYENGEWQVDVTFSADGVYSVYADIKPTNSKAIVLHKVLQVGSGAPSVQYPKESPNGQETVDGIVAQIDMGNAIEAGVHTSLSYTLTDDGVSVVPEQYLGALGHAVAIKHGDPLSFVHMHPEDQNAGSAVDFASEFSAEGIYTVFSQFKINDVVRTFPITITVAAHDDNHVHEDGHGDDHHHANDNHHDDSNQPPHRH